MMNPKQTIAYLKKLRKLGFTNEAFCRLHHFREKDRKETINSHRSYCEKRDSFDGDDGSNQRVQIRLGIVLKYFREYYAGNPAMEVLPLGQGEVREIFVRLADAAYVLVPPN
jgi:hypothetical protein